MDDIATASRTLGILCGFVLLAIFACALYRALRPFDPRRDRSLANALLILAAIAIVKLCLLPLFPGNWFDIQCWRLWSTAMAYLSPSQIYDPQALPRAFRCDYPPGYLYILWICGSLVRGFGLLNSSVARVLLESPPLITDFLLALTICVILRRLGPAHLAMAGMLLLALDPAFLFDTIVWGQSDSAFVLPIMLSAMLALDSSYGLAWAMAALAVLVKPQGLILIPVLGWWTMLEARREKWLSGAGAFAATTIAGMAPFQLGHSWDFMWSIYFSAAERYHQTSSNAFNLIGLIGGLRRPDSIRIIGVPAFTLGMALFAGAYALIAYILYRKRTPRTLLFSIFLSYLAMFVLAPRIHERYLYPAVAILVPLAFDSLATFVLFGALSLTLLFNLAYVLMYLHRVVTLTPHDPLASAAALINIAAFMIAALYGIAIVSGADARWPAALHSFFSPRALPDDRSAALAAPTAGRPRRAKSAGKRRS